MHADTSPPGAAPQIVDESRFGHDNERPRFMPGGLTPAHVAAS